MWMKLFLFIHAYGIILYINSVFGFGQVTTLIAMATFSLLWIYLVNSQVSVYRTMGPLVFYCNLIILAGNNDMHKSLNEFEFQPDPATDYGVTCP